MTADRDMTRVVREWLEDGANVMPDRVLDSVLDQIPATPQRRHAWQAWRNPFVSNTLKFGLTAAAVVLATMVGLGLYSNQPGVVGPQSSPTLQPSPTATPLSFGDVLEGQEVQPGTYVTDRSFPIRITFRVPEGWEKWHAASDAIGVMKTEGGQPAAGFGFWIVDEVYIDPCNMRLGGKTRPGNTVEDLAVTLGRLYRYGRTTPSDASLAGFDGQYIELTAPDDLARCDSVGPQLWDTPGGGIRTVTAPNERDRLWILDVNGTRLVVMVAFRPGRPAADIADLQQMVDSIRIDP